jgi:hypothetical protein
MMKKLQTTKAKNDAKLYPEVPIPKGCPLVHPRDKDPKRWPTLSHKVKGDLYAGFLQYLENWRNDKAGKHAASVYGFGSYGGPGNTKAKVKFTIPKNLAEFDPLWAAESAALDADWAKAMATFDDLDEAA